MLIDQYKEFLEKPSQETIQQFFYSAVNEQKDYSEELFSISKETKPVYEGDVKLRTSGSTMGRKDFYIFGPYFRITQKIVEDFLCSPEQPHCSILRVMGSCFPEQPPKIEIPPDAICLGPTVNAKDVVKRLKSYKDYVAIYTFMRHVQFLGQSKDFLDYAESVKEKLVISTSNTDAFFDKRPCKSRGIYYNDQMINWRTGMNFYTCRHQNRHCIKNLFFISDGKVRNLLNPNHNDKTYEGIDDLMEIEGTCPCGKGFVIKKFVPHYKSGCMKPNGDIIHDLSLADKIDTQWYMMQFYTKDDGKLYVYYVADEQPNKELIENHFGLPVEFVPNTIFRINEKLPVFRGHQGLKQINEVKRFNTIM